MPLEDIDAVGMKRRTWDGEKEEGKQNKPRKLGRLDPDVITPGCTLSALLNVLDSVASREGRIILMTSNLLEKLDEALLRPGRIDRKECLGHIKASGAEQLLRRISSRTRSSTRMSPTMPASSWGGKSWTTPPRSSLSRFQTVPSRQRSCRSSYSSTTIPPRRRSVKSRKGSPSRPVGKVGAGRERSGPKWSPGMKKEAVNVGNK